MDNNKLLQSAKDEAAREAGYRSWDVLLAYNPCSDNTDIINRAMEIYAEMVDGVYDIDFNGHVLARIRVSANGLVVTNAMDGYGNGMSIDKITIKTTNQ